MWPRVREGGPLTVWPGEPGWSSLVEKGGGENGRKGNGADGHGSSFTIQLKREEERLSLSFLFCFVF